jgi:outer membrane protein OmpA-like peptidoglycan-associated protein
MTTVHPKPQLQTDKGVLIRNSNNWMTVSDTIIAEGYERYIVLGSFLPNNMHKVEKVNQEARFMSAYYYFDDVIVELVEAPEQAESLVKVEPRPLSPAIDSTRVGFTFKLDNIYFEFDKSYLKPESKIALRKLYGFMERHPDVKIEIQGHTDGEGSYSYNEKLSERRAISVMRYLEQRGIKEGRMKTKGYGKRKPVASNETDEGRAMNRRVMIRILPSED